MVVRWTTKVGLTVALLAALAAGAQAKSQVTITYAGGWGTVDGAAGASKGAMMKALLADFEAKNPDIKVEWTNNSEYLDKLVVMAASGTGPDVVYIFDNQTDQGPNQSFLFSQGVFNSLTPYVNRDAAELKMNDFFPGTVEHNSYKGQLMSLPTYMASSGLYYNKDIFDGSGVAYPNDSWTWDDMRAAGKKMVKKDGAGKTIQHGYTPDGFDLSWSTGPLYWVWANGGDVVSKDEKQFGLTTNAARQALEYYYDLIFNQGIAVTPTDNAEQNWWTRFGNSTVGIWDSPSWNNTKGPSWQFDWDVAQSPKSPYTGQRSAYVHVRGHAMMSTTKHPEEAWRLIKYLSSPEVQNRWAAEIGYQPTRRSAAQAWLRFQPNGKKVNMQPFIETVAVGKYTPSLTDPQKSADFWTVVLQEWKKVISGTNSIQAFLDITAPLANAILQK